MRLPAISRDLLRRLATLRDGLSLAACLLCLGCFAAVCLASYLAARWDADRRAQSLATTTASVAAAELGRVFEQIDASLQSTMVNLALPGSTSLDEPLRSAVLFGRASGQPSLGFIDVMNEDGLVTELLPPSERGIRWVGRDYFNAQRFNPTAGAFVSRPFGQDDTIGIGLSRRLSRPDGTFAGVVVAGLRLAYVRDMLAQFPIGPHGSIELLRNDGMVLMHVPFNRDEIGRLKAASSANNVLLHMAMQPIGELPLSVHVAVADADVASGIEHWIAAVLAAGIVLSACCIAFMLAWRRQIGRRIAAEQISRREADYLAMASHELRLPLHSIAAHADGLRTETARNAAASRHLAAIADAGNHLQCVLDRMLDYLRIAPRLPLPRMRCFGLNELIDQCCMLVESDANARDLNIRFGFKPGAPERFTTDPDLLKQILLNLLSNAIRFTDRGEIAVEVGGTEQRVTIEVTDTGRGIAPSQRHWLFKPRERIEPDVTARMSSGIGLAMSLRLVQSLGGDIGYRENPVGGSIFWIGLPVGTLADLPLLFEHETLAA